MQNPTHDAEAAALSRIYALLIKKANEQKAKKMLTAEGNQQPTIQGFDNRPGSIGDNHHGK